MSVPSNWIRDLGLAPEEPAWDFGSTSHHSIWHTPFKTPDALKRLKLHLKLFACGCRKKAWIAVPILEETRFWGNTSHGLGSLKHTVTSALLIQSMNSKGGLAQEEAATKVSTTKTCNRSCAHLTSFTSLVSRREYLPLATLLLPCTMFPPSCNTTASAQQSFCWANLKLCSWSTLALAMGNSGMHQRLCKVQGQGWETRTSLTPAHGRKTPRSRLGRL